MVLLVGPRQAGKTWLAKDIATHFKNSLYLNYDQILDREVMLAQSWRPVDFALVKQEAIETMIEVKLSDRTTAKPLIHFREKYQYPAIQ